jgi:hypothetical protein
MGCCGHQPEQNIQARFLLLIYGLNENMSSHTSRGGDAESHSPSAQEPKIKYRILVGHCLEDNDDGKPVFYKFACNIDMSNLGAPIDREVTKSLFDKIPGELPSKVKEDFKRGNVNDPVLMNVKNLYHYKVDRSHFKKMILGIENKDNQNILFKGKGSLSEQEITDLKKRGVDFSIPEFEESKLVEGIKQMIQFRANPEGANDDDGHQLLNDGAGCSTDMNDAQLKYFKSGNTENGQRSVGQGETSV